MAPASDARPPESAETAPVGARPADAAAHATRRLIDAWFSAAEATLQAAVELQNASLTAGLDFLDAVRARVRASAA